MPITDPDALTKIVERFGGTPIPGRTYQFDLALSKVRENIPQINQLTGLRCEKVSERQDSDFNGRACSIARIELRRPPEPTEYDDERHLMWAAVR
jgi:hypothetical protein